MARAYFPLYFDQYISLVTNLNDEEAGRLFRAMLFYAKDGMELGLGMREAVVWPLIQRDIDNSRQAYLRRCAANAENGRKGGRKPEEKPNESDRFVSKANVSQAEEVKKAEEAEKAAEADKTEKSSLKAEEPKQEKQKREADQTVKAKQSGKAVKAGPVDVGERLGEVLDFEEKRKRAIAMLMDDHIREQREKLGIKLPEGLREDRAYG